MTQDDLSEALNVSKRSLQDYEAGTTIPWKHFQKLSAIFNRPLEWFLHGEEPQPEPESLEDPDVIERLDRIERLLEALVAPGGLAEREAPG